LKHSRHRGNCIGQKQCLVQQKKIQTSKNNITIFGSKFSPFYKVILNGKFKATRNSHLSRPGIHQNSQVKDIAISANFNSHVELIGQIAGLSNEADSFRC